METFLARQPIFDCRQKVYGYELLFRSGPENFFDHPDPDQASARVAVQSFLGTGIEIFTAGKKAFFNVSREFLLREYTHLLPREVTAVEIRGDMDPAPEVIAACKKLKEAGYLIALDHFAGADGNQPLVDLTDIVKVDFLTANDVEKRSLANRFRPKGIQLLAEKIETTAAFHLAKEFGYAYFQGYFFSQPVMVRGRDIPGCKLSYLRMLQEIHKPDLDFDQIERVIKQDVSLSYKLLRYVNSAFFGWENEIRSIKHALALMGEKDVKKWASLLALASMGEDKSSELIVSAIARARFCEAMAIGAGMEARSQELFLMGMFSLLDALLDRPLRELLDGLPLAREIKDALLGEPNRFRAVLEVVTGYERGDWDRFSYWVSNLNISEHRIPELYRQAVEWADQSVSVFSSLSPS